MGAYIIKVTNGSDVGTIENNIDVGFRYTDKLNSVNEAELKLSGTGSVKRGLLVMGATVEIYRNAILEFEGLIDNFDTLDAGGMSIHVSGKEIRLAQENGDYANSPWTSTASATINSAIIGESNYFSAGTIEAGVDVDFRLAKSQSIWSSLGNLAKKTGQDIQVNYKLDEIDILDHRGVSSVVAAFNDGLDIRNLRVSYAYPKGNKVKVYGKGDGANQIESDDAQGQDATSQGTYGVIKHIIVDRSVISVTEANARANIEVARIKDPTRVYDFECINPSPGGNELMESMISGYSSGYGVYGVNYKGQSFTVGNTGTDRDFYLEKLALNFRREASPGTVTIEIYEADGSGLPTGSVLSSGTYDGNTLPETYTWVDISMSRVLLKASTQYVITVKATTGDVSNYVTLAIDDSSPTYTGGNGLWSGNSGTTWNNNVGDDAYFKVYGFSSFNIKTGDHISLNSQDKDLTNEEVRIVGMERGLRGGTEFLSLQVTNAAFSELVKTGNQLLGQLQKGEIDASTYMQGGPNNCEWGGGINAKTNYPLRVGFYVSSDFNDEAGNLQINSLKLDYDVDKYKSQYGGATFDGSDPQVQNSSADTQPDITGTSGSQNNEVLYTSASQTPAATGIVSVWHAIQQTAIKAHGFVEQNQTGSGVVLYTTRSLTMATNTTGSSVTVDLSFAFASENEENEGNESLPNNTTRGFQSGESDSGNTSGWFFAWDDNYAASRWTGTHENIYSHTHGTHIHNAGNYTGDYHGHSAAWYYIEDHDHNDGSYDINAADINNISIGDDVSEAGSINASSVNIYLDKYNTGTSTWDNVHSVLDTGVTLANDVDISDSGTYPNSSGYWRVRVEPITATADFCQAIVKMKFQLNS